MDDSSSISTKKFITLVSTQFMRTDKLFILNDNSMQQATQALFSAIVSGNLATIGTTSYANPNTIFPLSAHQHISLYNLLITKIAAAALSKGPTGAEYRQGMQLLKAITANATLQCKCRSDHKCPLFVAISQLKMKTEEDILTTKCDLPRFLILKGATIKFQEKQDKKSNKSMGGWSLRWMDFAGIRNYLITKNFKYVQTRRDE